MLKRIAVIAEPGVNSAELEAALNEINCLCVPVTNPAELPPGTSVAVASGAVSAKVIVWLADVAPGTAPGAGWSVGSMRPRSRVGGKGNGERLSGAVRLHVWPAPH